MSKKTCIHGSWCTEDECHSTPTTESKSSASDIEELIAEFDKEFIGEAFGYQDTNGRLKNWLRTAFQRLVDKARESAPTSEKTELEKHGCGREGCQCTTMSRIEGEELAYKRGVEAERQRISVEVEKVNRGADAMIYADTVLGIINSKKV